jgi:hypothetical protein
MAKRNIFDRLKSLRPARPGRLLVFESTGCLLYGALATRSVTSSFAMGAPAFSAAPDPAAALGEILEQLGRQSKKRLPGTAVLITPCAAAELLYLPVNPNKPRPAAQMRELVRWELEELFARQSDIWSLGGLLMGRGFLSAQQRREAENAALAGQGARSGGAVYGGIVTSEQLDECLALQEQLTALDDELVAGWSPQAGREEEGRFLWYGAGTGEGIRSQWTRAFEKHGLTLSSIYPQLGAALPLMAPGQGGWLLVDIRQEQFGVFVGNEGLQAISRSTCPFGSAEPAAVAEAVRELIRPETRTVYLSAPLYLVAALSAELGPELGGRGVRLATLGEAAAPESCPPAVMASLQGGALSALRLTKPGILVRIAARDPKPPGAKFRELWPWAAILLLAASLGAYEAHLRVQAGKNEWQLELMDIEYKKKMKVKTELLGNAAEAKRLESELAQKERELKEQELRRDMLVNVFRHRQTLVPALLRAVSSAVGDKVMLDLLEENPDRSGFYLEGWALRASEAQLFSQRLNAALTPWKYRVEDQQLDRGKGRLDIDGFVLKLRLRNMAFVAPVGKLSGASAAALPPTAGKAAALPQAAVKAAAAKEAAVNPASKEAAVKAPAAKEAAKAPLAGQAPQAAAATKQGSGSPIGARK